MNIRNTVFLAFTLAAGLLLVSCGSKNDKASQVKYETKMQGYFPQSR